MPKSKSRNQSRNRKQSGGRVSLPAEYFGGNSGRYFEAGSPELIPASSSYGNTFASSHGVSMDGNQMGPDMGPYPVAGSSQTGGGCGCAMSGNAPPLPRLRRLKRKQRGGNCGLAHNNNNNAVQRGGNCGWKHNNNSNTVQRGGRVTMPPAYYQEGANAGYSVSPSTCDNGAMPVNTFGHNLSPCPGASGSLTGGARRRTKSKSKTRRSKSVKKSGRKSKKSGSKRSGKKSGRKSKKSGSKRRSRSHRK